MTWQSRVLDPGTDRESWERARYSVIGASDAKAFARPSSVEKYLAHKLSARSFSGNEYTARGHEWEPAALAHVGMPGNTALIHSPGEVGFAATPDGILPDGSQLAEAKVRHNAIASGPSVQEFRQLAFQFMCVPEALRIHFVEIELVSSQLGWTQRKRGPQVTVIERDDPRITAALQRVRPIAIRVLALLMVHREMELVNG